MKSDGGNQYNKLLEHDEKPGEELSRPQPTRPHLRTTSPPVPRPLWSAPAHSERIGAALSSPKTSTPRGTRVSTPARSTWPERGNHSPRPVLLQIARLLTKLSTINYCI